MCNSTGFSKMAACVHNACVQVLHGVAMCCDVLQCGVVCGSVLRCVDVHNACVQVLQCVAMCCDMLQCGVVCCSVLQCVAVKMTAYVHNVCVCRVLQ